MAAYKIRALPAFHDDQFDGVGLDDFEGSGLPSTFGELVPERIGLRFRVDMIFRATGTDSKYFGHHGGETLPPH